MRLKDFSKVKLTPDPNTVDLVCSCKRSRGAQSRRNIRRHPGPGSDEGGNAPWVFNGGIVLYRRTGQTVFEKGMAGAYYT